LHWASSMPLNRSASPATSRNAPSAMRRSRAFETSAPLCKPKAQQRCRPPLWPARTLFSGSMPPSHAPAGSPRFAGACSCPLGDLPLLPRSPRFCLSWSSYMAANRLSRRPSRKHCPAILSIPSRQRSRMLARLSRSTTAAKCRFNWQSLKHALQRSMRWSSRGATRSCRKRHRTIRNTCKRRPQR
jgi:hypothetical protein